MLESFHQMCNALNDILWGPVMIGFLTGIGLYLMIKLRFLPLRRLWWGMKCIVHPAEDALDENSGDNGECGKKKREGKGNSPFSALAMELACTIGTGNIIGVTSALMLGGPGALFWMNVSALIGMATKLAESSLAVKYHKKKVDGTYVGGPMYVAVAGIPVKGLGKLLGVSFAFFCVLSSFGVGNLTQVNSIAGSLQSSLGIPLPVSGFLVGSLCILILIGGVKAIARLACLLVPFMGLFYLAGAIWVIITHAQQLPGALQLILQMALQPQAVVGGGAGMGWILLGRSIRWGVSRGVFSNEAGLGASGISAASTGTRDYVRQGYVSMTSVFFDTILICTITGLAIVSSGVMNGWYFRDGSEEAAALTIAVFESALGEWGGAFISICISLFAFATIIGWAYQGEGAFSFLMGSDKYNMVYRLLYGMVTVLGAVISLDLVWTLADVLNALMAIPNLLCLVLLHQEICRDITHYPREGAGKKKSAGGKYS